MSAALTSLVGRVPGTVALSDFAGRHVHLIGVGGSGMSGLAAVLLRAGAHVSGTDPKPSELLERLAAQGASISTDQSAAALPAELDLIVASAAIADDHAELIEARRRGVEIIRYAEMLGLLMGERIGIAISGTHGKSTTTAWLTFVLKQAGLDPSFVVGASVDQLGGGSGVGDGPHFVAEACEFNRSFLNLRPRFAAILNVEADHLDFYPDLAEIQTAFTDFATLIPKDGLVVLNGCDPRCAAIARHLTRPVETFGFGETCDWQPRNLRVDGGYYTFDVWHRGRNLGPVSLGIAGRHNVLNALAVMALATRAGVEWPVLRDAIGGFHGVRRRLEKRGEVNGVIVVDDYGHHPTEIRATLQAARERFSPQRLWCVFQPHQYSRTRHLFEEFVHAFGHADHVILPEIFAARDTAEDKAAVSSERLAEQIRSGGRDAIHIPDFAAIIDHLAAEVRPGDVVITMGAGNIGKIADDLVQRLGGHLPA